MAPYQPKGVHPLETVHMEPGHHLEDEACFPPMWTGSAVVQPDDLEPYDMLTVDSLGLEKHGLVSRLLTWPYRAYIHWRLGTVTRVPSMICPIPWRINVAQADDVQHALAYTRHALETLAPGTKVILFGRSRGSLVALNVFVSLTDKERLNVAAVVLEGTFWDSGDVMRTWWPTLGPWFLRAIHWIGTWRPHGHLPFRDKATEVLPTTRVPIAVVGSHGDDIVHVEHTVVLHKFLCQFLPEEQVPLLLLKNATHSRYVYHNAEDQQAYTQFLRDLWSSIKT